MVCLGHSLVIASSEEMRTAAHSFVLRGVANMWREADNASWELFAVHTAALLVCMSLERLRTKLLLENAHTLCVLER